MQIVVVGGGVIGLTAAVELLGRGHDVTIWRREPGIATVSGVAAAVWYPYLAEPRERVLGWSHVTYGRLVALVDEVDAGVAMLPVVELFGSEMAAPDWLPAGARATAVDPTPFGDDLRSAWQVEVPLCEPARYLPWLERQVRERDGRIVEREVHDWTEPLAIAERVVNCTGLGARDLCGDTELEAVRGQVVRVAGADLPFGIIDDTDASQPIYVMPRSGDVVLGGTATRDHSARDALAVAPVDRERIRRACARRVPAVAGLSMISEAVGLRPYRSTVRLEVDPDESRLLHNYGHGGSGFTLAWGCARELATRLENVE
ncbi:MAG: FAD-binding oxidoreductase [bacterium]|nr:FAD-binding oxidoreductase [bacterium]